MLLSYIIYSVCHIAGEFITALKMKHEKDKDQDKDPNLKITEEEVLAVKIAALCHDLGVVIIAPHNYLEFLYCRTWSIFTCL